MADVDEGVVEILATQGDVYLGGTDIDNIIVDYVAEEFLKSDGVDIRKDPMALQRLKDAAEKVKIELSTSTSSEFNLPYITAVDGMPKHLVMTLNRAKFEQLITPIADRIIAHAKTALKQADLSGKDLDGILLVGGSCRIPLIKERLEKEIGAKLIESANLDLAVAEGAAVQGGIINGESDNSIVLVDVTPLTYGIETMGGVMTTLIEGNSTIPCKKSEVFSTAVDNQPSVTVRVMQGNRPMAKDNKEIGIFNLDGIMPAPRGIPQIEVTFDIDANGILKVTALDKGTNKEQHVTIQPNGGLSDDDIKRMQEEAEKYAEADKKEREIADTVNKGDSIVFTQEKLLKEHDDKLSDTDKTEITAMVEEMKVAVKEKNVDVINSTEKRLNDKWNEISQKIYSQQPSSESNTSSTDNTQDADFEEVK